MTTLADVQRLMRGVALIAQESARIHAHANDLFRKAQGGVFAAAAHAPGSRGTADADADESCDVDVPVAHARPEFDAAITLPHTRAHIHTSPHTPTHTATHVPICTAPVVAQPAPASAAPAPAQSMAASTGSQLEPGMTLSSSSTAASPMTHTHTHTHAHARVHAHSQAYTHAERGAEALSAGDAQALYTDHTRSVAAEPPRVAILESPPTPAQSRAGDQAEAAVPSASTPAPAAAPPVTAPKRVFRERAVPASPLSRVFGFGTLAAGMAAGAVTDALSTTLFGRGSQTSGAASGAQAIPASAIGITERQAERLAEGLCRMRGAALKIGQMLSLSDETLLPPQVAKVLERVRTQADIMPRRQLEAVMKAELGEDWRERLGGENFQMQPVAAASIGQVHRSRLPDGRDVAIKVQYPGVAESINSDLNNLKTLLTVANFLPKGLYLDSVISVAREELTAECDYRREAAAQEKFRALVADDPDFEIPAVVPEVSTRRVLVTTWMDGSPIDSLMNGQAPQETRNRVARKLLKLTLRELFEWRYMQTDPNWGNFFYIPGRDNIGLLDFGAAREYSKEFVDDYLQLVWAAANRDRQTIHDISVKLGFLTGYESKVMLDAHIESGLVVGEPFASSGAFDFKASGITARVSKYGSVFAEHRLTPPPAEIYSLHRKLAGAFLMCIRLEAVMHCRDLLEDTWHRHKWGTE